MSTDNKLSDYAAQLKELADQQSNKPQSECHTNSYSHGHYFNNTCPSCGYCPHCGRGGGYYARPYWPHITWTGGVVPATTTTTGTGTIPPSTSDWNVGSIGKQKDSDTK